MTAILRAGGRVMYDGQWQWKQGSPVLTGTTRWPAWVVDHVGVDTLANVNYVELKYRGSDELLEQVGQLHRLEYLNLAGSPVTDAGLAQLQGLTALRWLSLDDTRLTDAGLVHLNGLGQLQNLSLGLTRVSDAGLPHLKPLTGLKTLSLVLTSISDEAGQDLPRLAGARIVAGGWGAGQAQGRAIKLSEKAARTRQRGGEGGVRRGTPHT